MNRIHLFGASGSGTSTLGRALADRLAVSFFDVDDYYWQKTNPPYTEKVPVEQRYRNLQIDLQAARNWVLSGSLVSWGDSLKTQFTLAVFLYVPAEVRLERLRKRELERYSDRILPGGDIYEINQAFLDWASRYDTAGLEQRSLLAHQNWMKTLDCPLLRLGSSQSVQLLVAQVLEHIGVHS